MQQKSQSRTRWKCDRKVVDDSGNNVAGVIVSLVKDGQEVISVQTKADGTYTIEDVLAGTYTIQVVKDGYEAPQQAATVEVKVGETVTAPQVAMVKRVGTISGTVRDQSGIRLAERRSYCVGAERRMMKDVLRHRQEKMERIR